METADPPVPGPPVPAPAVNLAPGEPAEPVLVPPPVVAVVVTNNPGAWLEATLEGVRDSDYPNLAVLVLDAGSDDDPTPRIAAVLPRAFVRRLETDVGFACAANEALDAVEGATFLFLFHDDVVLEPSTIRLLVEEAYRSNAGIVGPKLVDPDNPEVLLEVGMAIDRFGVEYSGIEPGELDQEQHDGVRDVFYVSSAAMLLRADLFAELAGFDPETSPGGEDLDLCWRARLIGARVLVAPDARARHYRAGGVRSSAQTPDERLVLRHRLRALLKAYSALTLLWVVPIALLLGLLESAVFVASRRGARARAVFGAWIWNLRHFGELRTARRSVQASRRIPDSDLRWLQFRGSARARNYVADHVHAEARIQSLSDVSRDAVDTARSRLREPLGIALVVFAVVFVFGTREILFGHVPAVGQFLPWPGVGDLLSAFGSGWRHQGLGSASTPPPVFAALAGSGTLLLGATGLARSILVTMMVPLGVIGAFRLTRHVAGNRRAALAAALVYGINPVARNALANGRLGPLVFYALAPFLLQQLMTRSVRPAGENWPARIRRHLPLVALLAVATAFWPPAFLVVTAAAIALLVAQPLAGDDYPGLRSVRTALIGSLGALVLLLPWPLALLRSGERSAAWGLGFPATLDLSQVLRFHTGPAGAGAGGWALLLAAALAVLVTTGPRLAWAARAWVLALVGFGLAWLPTVLARGAPVPAPEGLLVPAALGIALAVGLGVGAFRTDLHHFQLGWRQIAAVAVPIVLVLPALGFAADALDGRWHAPSTDWNTALSWMDSEQTEGGFRVLWVGDPDVLPIDATVVSGYGIGYGITRGGPGGVLDLWPAPGGAAAGLVGEAVTDTRNGLTNRLGHLLAPMGVRYVALPPGSGANGGVRADPTPPLTRGLADQLDLSRLESEGGLVLYENDAWAPTPSVLPGEPIDVLRPDAADPSRAALRSDLVGAHPVRSDAPTRAGAVLLSEAYSSSWTARSGDRSLNHVEAFGWSNGFEQHDRGSIGFRFTAQWQRNLVAVVQVGVWLAFAVFWVRSTAVGTRVRRARRARRVARAAEVEAAAAEPVPVVPS
ncbi:MAG: glycosyltransferase [Acidimicrobiia bacterium]